MSGQQCLCGVVTTSCVAGGLPSLVWWARYHVSLGVRHIYLYIHDARAPLAPDGKGTTGGATSSVKRELCRDVEQAMSESGLVPDRITVAASIVKRHYSDECASVDVVSMQERNVREAIKGARSAGLEWLFHIDDDELLHLTRPGARGADALARVFGGVSDLTFNLRLDNLEVQKVSAVGDSTYNFFEHELAFKLRVGLHADGSRVERYHDPRYYVYGGNPATGADGHTAPYLSYWNGKSAGRLAELGLKPCGVHFFASTRGDAAKLGAQERSRGIVLLHYPFCHFRTWRHKFNVLDASQRSDWGHYRQARLAIVDALAPDGGGEPVIAQFYRSAVLGVAARDHQHASFVQGDTELEQQQYLLAIYMPPEAAPQEWRSGIYKRTGHQCYELMTKHGALEEPASYLYKVPHKSMWLVGSTPGATTGAAVVYDAADEPWRIRSPWTVYNGSNWVASPDAAVGRLLKVGDSLFSLVDAGEVLSGQPSSKYFSSDAASQHPQPDDEQREHVGPDHARLAGIVVSAIDTHKPYRDRFWEAVTKAAGREPPGDLADRAVDRALSAGARAMGAPAVASSLVAERMRASSAHSHTLRSVVESARQLRASLLDKHADQDVIHLAMPGLHGVQAWRAGLYARVKSTTRGTDANTSVLYRRVRDCASNKDSFLFPVPSRGMWLVGSTPGSTTGGLVAYDRASRPQDLKATWHVYDGSNWIQTPEIVVKPISAATFKNPQSIDDDSDKNRTLTKASAVLGGSPPSKRAAVVPIRQ